MTRKRRKTNRRSPQSVSQTRERNRSRASATLAAFDATPVCMLPSAIPAIRESLIALSETGRRSSIEMGILKPNSFIASVANAISDVPKASYQPNARSNYSSHAMAIGSTVVIGVEGLLEPKESYLTRWGYATAMSEVIADTRRAREDSEVDEIVFYFDTIGGRTQGVHEFADEIYKTGQVKSTIGIGDGYVASGGYWTYSATKRKVASPSTVIGSVGAMITPKEYSKYHEEFGMKATPIFFGKHKANGNEFEPLSEAARASFQRHINDIGKQFVNAVAKHQGITDDEVMANYGQGEMFLAPEALKRGMIDEIGTFNIQTTKIQTSSGSATSQSTAIDPTAQVSSNTGPVAVQISVESRVESPVSHDSATDSGDSVTQKGAEMKFTAKAKSALHFAGMIASHDATDETCMTVIQGFCLGRGMDVPTDEEGILAVAKLAIGPVAQVDEPADDPTDPATPAPSAAAPAVASPNPQTPTPQTPQTPTPQAATADAADRDRLSRQDTLSYAYNLLASAGTFSLSANDYNAAVASNQSTDDIIADWQAKANGSQADGENLLPGQIRFTADSNDKFQSEAANRLLEIAQIPNRDENATASSTMRNWSGQDVFEECLVRMNVGHQRGDEWRMSFNNALAVGQNDGQEVALERTYAAGNGSVNTPGTLGAVVAQAVDYALDDGMEAQEQTYTEWCGRAPDFMNLDPKRIYALSEPKTLDVVSGTEEAKEFAIEQELLGHLFVNGFQNFIGLTWEMSLANNVSDFLRRVALMSESVLNTEQELCLKVLFSKENFGDTGLPLFSANAARGNLFTNGSTPAGAAPSNAQAQVHENAMLNRKGVGANARRIKLRPSVVLYSTEQKQAIEQTYGDPNSFREMIQKTSDSTINTHRGKVKMVLEPELADYDATGKHWFSFADPRRHPAIIYARLAGYGAGGRRTMMFNPRNHCHEYHLRHAAGAGAKNWRYANEDWGGATS